ncbi:MAG: polyphosphate kinase 1 [Treponema sp.]|nr:polyphosphate kinase 1 [Treponema sp.]
MAVAKSPNNAKKRTSAKKQMTNDKYLNRELSWIEFNDRVLREGKRSDIPLLEQLNFLSIVTSNFNEFFQVRVASVKRLLKNSPGGKDISGRTPKQQLKDISTRARQVMQEQQDALQKRIIPALAKEGFVCKRPKQFTVQQKEFAQEIFKAQILPLLTPLRTDSQEFPKIANLKWHAAFLLKPISGIKIANKEFAAKPGTPIVALVQIPDAIPNLIWLPGDKEDVKEFTTVADLLLQYGSQLFDGYEATKHLLFNVALDADFAVDEDANDIVQAMQEVLVARQSSFAVRMVCDKSSSELQKFLAQKLNLKADDIYAFDGLVDAATLCEIGDAENTDHLRNKRWENFQNSVLPEDEPYWDTIKRRDVILHVPYESYNPVVKFLNDAADDPEVLSIKMTLYRTGRGSPIISALEKAARNGKQVTVLVELKARFDEERNIAWAEELEKAGVLVVYGLVNLKVHAKILMVIRREQEAFKRYVHLATGNYNPRTARIYSDLSLFTANHEIANDATKFFNIVTGYSALQKMKYLAMAPVDLKSKLLSMIQREIELSTPQTPGLIIAKMNSLADEEVISALYKANRAGVRVMLNIRGICMLLPGVPGMSENIRVVSIVDRYLEHSRVFYFQNGASPEIYLASADWMPRNLDRRIELMFPILDSAAFKEIKRILDVYFDSNINSYELQSDGSWTALKPKAGESPKRAQEILYNEYKARNDRNKAPKTRFIVRRK